MKKYFLISIFIVMFLFGNVQAEMSESFQKMLSLMNVPSKNVDGYEVNEEIYYKYALMVYGSPKDITKNQRWKDVATGKWINEETGRQGEYRVLGYSLTGTVVNNELFPDDYTSGILPEEWNYIEIEDALASWNNTEKYQTEEQYQYMLHQNLSRNGITYNLTASNIGLNKTRLEAYATWKTAGSIFTLKRDDYGRIWEATFNVPPMSAEAQLTANLEFPNGTQYKLGEGEDTLVIPFSFGANVTGLSSFAKVEDIRKLSSEIEVENVLYDKMQKEKALSLWKDNQIVIHRSDYPGANKVQLEIKNTAVLETCFQAEAPMVDIQTTMIEITLKEEEEEKYVEVKDRNKQKDDTEIVRPKITSIKLYRKTVANTNQKEVLKIAKKTNIPFICAGQVLIVEASVTNDPKYVDFAIEGGASIQTLDSLTKKFLYEEPRTRGEKLVYSLETLKSMYKLPAAMEKVGNVYQIEYVIPYSTKQTIHSWSTLRNSTGDAFEIDKTKLFSRIINPYRIKIQAQNEGGITTSSINLDVFERWDTIYNRDISEYLK